MMHKRMGLACLLLLAAAPAMADDKKAERWKPNLKEQEVLSSQAFLADHPDMLNRIRGMEELQRGDKQRAANYFRRAARYADKQSQAAYAEMLWEGNGIPQDRPAAYAWMDLAAERGYTLFLGFREKYWEALDEAERKRALEVGQAVYAEYGDDVAQPRMENILRRASRNVVGSRTGFVGAVQIILPGPGEGTVINGSDFYDTRFWEPRRYWRWQGQIVEGVKEGRVIVGDLKREHEAPEDEDKD